MDIQKKVTILGKVQDVGYRLFLYKEAENEAIVKFEANNSDEKGKVEVLLGDEKDKVEKFIEFIRHNFPKNAIVNKYNIEEYDGNIMTRESFYRKLTTSQLEKMAEVGMGMIKKQDNVPIWRCKEVIITKEGCIGVEVGNDIKNISLTSLTDCILVSLIKMNLRYADGSEPLDDAKIVIRKQKSSDPSWAKSGQSVTNCIYQELKRGLIPNINNRLSFQESIDIYLTKDGIEKDIRSDDIMYNAKICIDIKKEKGNVETARKFDFR